MKFIKAFSLLIIFLSILLLALLWLLLTQEKLISFTANHFLHEHNIQIAELANVDISLNEIDIGHIKILRENISLSLDESQIKIQYHGSYPELESLAIRKLALRIDSSSLETASASETSLTNLPDTVELSSLFPQTVYPLLKNLDLRIDESVIVAPDYLQHDLAFQALTLSEMDNTLKLKIASLLIDNQQGGDQFDIGIQVSISETGTSALLIKVHNAENKKTEDSLAIELTPAINEQGNIELELNSEIKLNQIATFIKQDLKNSAGIHTIKGTLDIKSTHILKPVYTKNSDIQDMFLASSIHSKTNLNIVFQDHALESLNIKLLADLEHKNSDEEKVSQLLIDKKSELKFQPNPGSSLFKDDPALAFLSGKPFIVKPEHDLLLTYKNTDLTMSGELGAAWADSSQPAFVDLSLTQLSGKVVNIDDLQMTISHTLHARWNKFFTTDHNGRNKISFKKDVLSFSSTLRDEALKTSLDVNGSFKESHLNTSYQLEIKDFSGSTDALNETIAYWDEDFKLLNGKISAVGTADIYFPEQKSPSLHYQMLVSAEDIDIDYDGMIITHLNTQTKLKGKDKIFETDNPFVIKVDKVFSGISAEKIRVASYAKMNLEGLSTVYFTNLKLQVLGGTANSEAFTMTIPFSREDASTKPLKEQSQPYFVQLDLDIKDVELGNILALQGNPEIEGNGLLFGKLPITVTEKNTLISKGWIKNQNPGTLQYRPDSNTQIMLSQNMEMRLLLEVLGHLDYHTLTAEIDLNDEGLMKINGSLQGVNPDFKKGYPLIFNPNIELDFRDMLKSLEFTGDVSDSLAKRVHQN